MDSNRLRALCRFGCGSLSGSECVGSGLAFVMKGRSGLGLGWGQCRLGLLALVAGVLMAGCGGGDTTTASNAAASGGGGSGGGAQNQAPTIAGSPAGSVMQDSEYSFTPTADDADGDTLTFMVTNLPSWATFDGATGQISGTPGPEDLGTYSGITISVTDGQQTARLTSFEIDVVATATGSAQLSWTAPTTRTDGSALTDLAGFKVYWGTEQGNYSHSVTLDNPSVTTYVVEELTPATWHFVATAYDSNGVESAFSNPASKTIN